MSAAAVTPASVQIPSEPDAPVIADFHIHALRVAYVAAEHVAKLGTEWKAPGVYMLSGRADASGRLPLYVGKSVDLRGRLAQHRAKPKLVWTRAMAVRRDTSDGFNSAEIGYLEGRLRSECEELSGADLLFGQKDSDNTLPSHFLPVLDAFVPTILAAARLGGVSLMPAELAAAVVAASPTGPQKFDGTVADLLAAGLLSAGALLTCSRAGKTAQATVTSDGELVVDGKAYSSPSSAAQRGLDVQAANGWTTWRLAGGTTTLADLRAQLGPKVVDPSV